MRVIVDGDAVFVAADDFVDLQVSDVTWVDVPASELADYLKRDRLHADERKGAVVAALLDARRVLVEAEEECPSVDAEGAIRSVDEALRGPS